MSGSAYVVQLQQNSQGVGGWGGVDYRIMVRGMGTVHYLGLSRGMLPKEAGRGNPLHTRSIHYHIFGTTGLHYTSTMLCINKASSPIHMLLGAKHDNVPFPW